MDRSKMVRRAVCRWIAANLEPGKSANVDFLDLVDRFNDHAASNLAGLTVSNSRLIGYLEEEFRGAKFDEATNRIHGVNWRKVTPVVHEPKPEVDPKDQALAVRLMAFLNQGSVFIARGSQGFTTAAFAGWRDVWLTSIGAQIRHDRIDPKEAQAFLERSSMVELRDDGLWYVKV
jgi:hypothetical protein